MILVQHREAESPGSSRDVPRTTMACLAAGLTFGVLTNLAQGVLPGAWNQLANSGAVWCLAAYVAGMLPAARGRGGAAAGGLATEVGLVIGYYAYAEFGRDGMGMLAPAAMWLMLALVAGPLFGAAGAWRRCGTLLPQRVLAGGIAAGVFGAEAMHYAFILHYVPQACACLALMGVLALAGGRTLRERALSFLAACPLALIGYILVYAGFLGSL